MTIHGVRYCTNPECDREWVPGTGGRGFCDRCYRRLLHHGDVSTVLVPRAFGNKNAAGIFAEGHHNWVGDDVGYVAAHDRVRATRGRAKEHSCVDCGNPAYDWTYDHNDVNELTNERGLAYSADPAFYSPRCRSCHRYFDHKKRLEHAS